MRTSRFILRVTSVWSDNTEKTIFACVAVNGNTSAKKFYVVHVKNRNLPLPVKRGQIWKISGFMSEREVIKNNVTLTEVNIKATKLKAVLPEGENTFITLIANDNDFKGVGQRLALKIWLHFGKRIYKVLEAGSLNDLLMMQGIGLKSAKSMISGWHKYKNIKYITWFDKHNIPSGISMNLMKHHDLNAIKSVEEDPYRLITFGLSFLEADQLAKNSFGFKDDSPERLLSVIEIALNTRIVQGHTVSTHENIYPIIEKTLGSSKLTVQALSLGCSNASFFIGDNGLYHSMAMWAMESVVAKRLASLAMKETWSTHYEEALKKATEDLPFSMTQKQSEAVIMSFSRGASVIAGGAGTGKTTVLRVVMKAYSNLGVNIKAMALSGRAAMQITESTQFYAQTIARFLKNEMISPGERAIVVIDEASMLDLPTMFKIITRIPKNTRILLVGDPNQLSPIGAGKVLQDVIYAITTTTLDIVKRQQGSTGIPEFSEAIRDKKSPEIKGNIRFHAVKNDEINKRVTELYMQNPSGSQVIAPKYAGNGGIDVINEVCQRECNANGTRIEFDIQGWKQYIDIREGDPVIFTENNWKRGVQNGTLGTVLSTTNRSQEINGDEFSVADIKLDDEKGTVIPLTIDLLDSIRPAYAISLHKAQGSQFKRVIIPIMDSNMVDNAWVYTAVTRAEIEIELVGREKVFELAILRQSAANGRDTYLKHLLLLELANLKSKLGDK